MTLQSVWWLCWCVGVHIHTSVRTQVWVDLALACEFEGVMVLEGILSEIEEADLVARLDSCEAGGPHS